ncbi:MAG: SDR family NAD(P)-dependent oxidoreductase [Deltaproteobacteria bacterium]|nr:SDR family NAD(P)-dependent oxidoreductase [Deltaproteobacteria bacterium]
MREVVIVGGTRGIGRAVAEALGGEGARLTIVGRDSGRGEEVARGIEARGGAARFVAGDLASTRTTRALARELLERCERIDALVHVAGIWPAKRELNEDGLERAFAVNHLAPFLLDHLLEPRLFASRARVVQVSAGLYVKGRLDLARTPTGEDFHPIRTYASTKLANLMTIPRFAARWGDRASIVAVHPGVIRTDLGDRPGLLGALLRLVKRTWRSPKEGARPVVRLVDAEVPSGSYFHESTLAPLLPVATDPPLVEALWNATASFARLSEEAPEEGSLRAAAPEAAAR